MLKKKNLKFFDFRIQRPYQKNLRQGLRINLSSLEVFIKIQGNNQIS